MKIARAEINGKQFEGIVVGESIEKIFGSAYETFTMTGIRNPLSDVKILPPCQPSKIIAIGLNYKDHAAEFGSKIPDEPMLFMKPSTAVIGHRDIVSYPPQSKKVDYEGELAIVIKKTAKNISEGEAKNYILGFTCANDITARDLQRKDGQFTRGKGFDTFAPIGPWIETDLQPDNLKIKTTLNGNVVQSSSTSQMIFKPYFLVSFISCIMTLLPGDVIITGTPCGVGELKPSDVVQVEIEGIGVLENRINSK
ncbi:MAG: fumarylacetoacetate hydrolase family protein [Candidatus Schekmanbacteria bacterium]|nr:fumarylacetoacetate hydrolase family protein [Candidatus Schekmanbacteria bacterium]